MNVIEQGTLRISGIPCDGAPFQLKIRQGFNRHGIMEAAIWFPEKEKGQIDTGLSVVLSSEAASAPLFCGVITRAVRGKEKGRDCVRIRVKTRSIELDREKRIRSFQKQGRSHEELIRQIAKPYGALSAWEGSGAEKPVGRFFLQYEETDWEFMKRVASGVGLGLLPESRMDRTAFYIGLPEFLEETELEADHYSVKSRMPGMVMEDGTVCTSLEYILKNRYETLHPGDRVRFMGARLVVAEQESELSGGYLKSSYVLRPESGFQTEPIWNYGMIGASIPGKVLESSPEESRLQLGTDGEGEPAESWHRRPVFYAGGGRGYSGRPENGDTLYLYFPTEHEEDRTVIGGAGAGYEKVLAVAQQIQEDTETEEKQAEEAEQESRAATPELELERIQLSAGGGSFQDGARPARKVDAASLPGFKNWSTPGRQGLSLNERTVRFHNKGGNALSLGDKGIRLHSKGDAKLKGTNGLDIQLLKGKRISLSAKEYIYLNCGMSEIALLPQEVHIKGTRVFLESPENEDKGPVYTADSIEELKKLYYEAKWGSPLQQFMPDGTVIGRVDGLEENAALRKYFEENVLGTEGYVNYLDSPMLETYYENGTYNPDAKGNYENNLYKRWLTNTYGKTDFEKFADYLTTSEGIHTVLDVVGVIFDAADGLNAVIYVAEGKSGEAALSAVSLVPILGSVLGKGEKYISKAADLSKLGRNLVNLSQVERISVFLKARKIDVSNLEKWLGKWGGDLAGYLKGKPYLEYVTPEGFRYQVTVKREMELAMEVTDELGDTVRFSRRVGDGAEDAGKIIGRASEAGESIGKVRIEGNKNIFTNNSGKEIIWTNQTSKDIESIIASKLNSLDSGDLLEGKVAAAVKEVVEVRGVGLKLSDITKSPAGDLDIVTDNYIIEVKTSLGAVKEKQIPKYTDPSHPNYVNSNNKKVIYFIEDSTPKVPKEAQKLQKLKDSNAIVVDNVDDLKEILKNG